MSLITIERKVLEKNDVIAEDIRNKLKQHKIFSFNLVSSPGSGKTSIVEQTIKYLKNKIEIGVIEGDVQTDLDAQRVNQLQIPVAQIVTNGGCHLEAGLVRDALMNLDYTKLKVLIIENVGNLVCPSGYDLGEDLKVVILSTTEGNDKPLKYPSMFRRASVLITNKIDLLPYVNYSIDKLKQNALSINPELIVFEVSCITNQGIDKWCDWILTNINK